MITLERWRGFDRRFQLFQIAAEFERARTAEETGVGEHKTLALKRALQLIDLTMHDEKWTVERPMFEGLKTAVQEFIANPSRRGVAILYQVL